MPITLHTIERHGESQGQQSDHAERWKEIAKERHVQTLAIILKIANRVVNLPIPMKAFYYIYQSTVPNL